MQYNFNNLSKAEALSILNLPDADLPELIDIVFAVRKKQKGTMVGIQLLTNARSGDCSQNCAYCAQSQYSKASIEKYKLISYDKLLMDNHIVQQNRLSRHCMGFSGIRFTDAEIDEFVGYIRKIKKDINTQICCSIGFLTVEQAKRMKEAGVNRINHNLNTSKAFYPKICTTHTYQERIDNIKMLQGMGFEICCGGIIGLGEEKTDVVDMLFEIRELKPQSVPINFLIPIQGTVLENREVTQLSAEYCLKVLCLARLLTPTSDIRCAAGREVYLKGREKELFCVVDSIFASGYLTADGQSIEDTIKIITEAGFQYYIEAE